MSKKINWRKEGCVVGDSVLVISKNTYAYESRETEYEAEVIYVGVTVLKVKIPKLNDKVFIYRNCRATSGLLIGDRLFIYKNKEAHEQKLKEIEEKKFLVSSIISELRTLDIDTLRKISKLIK